MSSRWIPDKQQRRHAHSKWYLLKGGRGVTYRVLRFGGNLSGSAIANQWDMVIDWPAWLELSGHAEDVPDALEVELKQTSIWRSPQLAFSRPTVRLATWLGFLSFVLGLLSWRWQSPGRPVDMKSLIVFHNGCPPPAEALTKDADGNAKSAKKQR